MINSYTHPSVVGGDIRDTIRNALAQTLVDNILAAHLFRLPLGMPCASRIFAIPDQCLFLRVHRYHRLSTFLKRPDVLGDMRALRIAIAMRAAFLGFPIGLQAIVQIVEQPGDGVVTHVVSLLHECIGKVTGALACPPQRRLRVPTGGRLQEGWQVLQKGTVMLRHTSPPSAPTTDSVRLCLIGLLSMEYTPLHCGEPGSNGGTREASGLSDCRDASPPEGHRCASGPAAPHFFAHHRAQSLVLVPECSNDLCIWHTGPSGSLSNGQGFKKGGYR